EGYPGRRYYGGCEFVDVAERLAIERAKQLFGCGFANVQPHAGAQANQAVFLALLKPGDTILGMSLAAGGHLTHGASPNLSGKWFDAVSYGVRADDARIDFDEVEHQAETHRPRLIIAGGSAYPRIIDFARFRAIADRVGASLMVDMAHFAGLVAGRAHPSPLPPAHAVINNPQTPAAALTAAGLAIVSRGTDTHLLLVDLRPLGLPGRDAEQALERAGITCNKNGIPFDPQKPTVTSGIRLGSPAATTRGFGPAEFGTIGRYIVEVLRALAQRPAKHGATEARVRDEVRELCARFPIYA